MLSISMIATACLLALACVLTFRTRSFLSSRKLRQAWLRFACIQATVTSFVLFFGVSSIWFEETSVLAIYLLPPCFAALVVSLCLLVRLTLKHLRHLYQRDGIGIFDKVTGVHNRYYLEQRLEAEIARSNRYSAPLALVSVKIVGFETLNDEFGHQAGDMAATVVARSLKSKLRETDVVTRYLPGCFLLILPDTPEGNVFSLIHRLDNALKNQVIIEGSEFEKPLCVSVGFGQSTCTLATSNAEQMIVKSLGSLEPDSRLSVNKNVLQTNELVCELL